MDRCVECRYSRSCYDIENSTEPNKRSIINSGFVQLISDDQSDCRIRNCSTAKRPIEKGAFAHVYALEPVWPDAQMVCSIWAIEHSPNSIKMFHSRFKINYNNAKVSKFGLTAKFLLLFLQNNWRLWYKLKRTIKLTQNSCLYILFVPPWLGSEWALNISSLHFTVKCGLCTDYRVPAT